MTTRMELTRRSPRPSEEPSKEEMHVKSPGAPGPYARYSYFGSVSPDVLVDGPHTLELTHMKESRFLSTRVVYSTLVLVNSLNRGRDLSGSSIEVPRNGSFGAGSASARVGESPVSAPESTAEGGVRAGRRGLGLLASPSV